LTSHDQVAILETTLSLRHPQQPCGRAPYAVAGKNVFDAIVVAGDIGNDGAPEFFRIMQSFKCPILYVYGN
jgi:hypothetical protein